MPLRFLRGGNVRLALSVLAVAAGVALVCAIHIANRAVLRAFVEVVDTMAGRAELEVVAGEGGLFPEGIAEMVRAVTGVETAVAAVKAAAFTVDGSGDLVTVYGVDLGDGVAERVYGVRLAVDEPLDFLSRTDSLAVTRAFAARHELEPGGRIELATPAGRRTLTLRGLLEAEGVARAYGGNVAVMDLYGAQALFARPGLVTGVDVVLAPGADPARVAEAIAERLPDGLRIATPAHRQTDLRRVTESLRVALHAMALCGLVAAFLITFNRLGTAFEERAWQLGVLRAVGVRRRAVWRELLAESLLVGAAGVAVGLPVGVLLGRALVPVIATTSALACKLVAPAAALVVEPVTLAGAAGLGLMTALLAGALPAWRAARAAAAETLRSRGLDQPGASGRAHCLVRLAALAAIGLAIVTQARRPSAGSALVATALVAIGTALAARPALGATGTLLVEGSRRLAGPTGRLAAESFLHNPRRAALTVATLGVGLGCVVWFWTLAQSFRSSLVDALTAGIRADLVVTSVHVTHGYVEAPVSEELVGVLAAAPGVSAVVGSRVVDWPHRGRRIAVEALDGRYFVTPELGRWPLGPERIPEVWERVARGEAAIVSANFALNFGAQVGDYVVLDTPSGLLALVVGGVTAAFESPAGTVQMAREVFRRHWRDGLVNRVGVKAAPGVPVSVLRRVLRGDRGVAHDLRILSAHELIDHYAAQVRRAFAPLDVLAAMVLLVTLFGLADTLFADVVARTPSLAAMRAVGVRRAPLARMIVLEALLLGVLGLGLAAASGLGLATLWVNETLPYLLGWVLDLHVPYREIPVVAAVTAAVAGAAALVPACRAARLEPGRALRQE
jgi:putative ABC transport system permease protein